MKVRPDRKIGQNVRVWCIITPRILFKGKQLLRLPVCFHGHTKPLKRWSIFKENNLLTEEKLKLI